MSAQGQVMRIRKNNLLVSYEDNHLTLDTGKWKRTFVHKKGELFPQSLSGFTPAQKTLTSEFPLFKIPGITFLNPCFNLEEIPNANQESLIVDWNIKENNQTVIIRFTLFANPEAIHSQLLIQRTQIAVAPSVSLKTHGVIESNSQQKSHGFSELVDHLPLEVKHLKVTHVKLYDQTDHHDHLVEEQTRLCHPLRKESFTGNLFIVEDFLNHQGMLLAKVSPTPHAQLNRTQEDLFVQANQAVYCCGSGLSADEISTEVLPTYGWTLLLGTPQELPGLYRAHLRRLMSVASREKIFSMSNTWGDRSRDAALNEKFMLTEIETVSKCHIDKVMIDDGWQKGRTANSALSQGGAWGSYWETQPDFWTPDLGKFPHGLKPLVDACHKKGTQLSLWYSPDSSNEFEHWEKDLACLLGLYQTYGINTFKLDGITLTSLLASKRLEQLFQSLHQAAPEIILCLDVTAEIRPGYLPLPEHVHLFLENRYTDWGNYHPHRTLKALWQLSKWVPSIRLQIEILNPTRSLHKYVGDLLAPSRYPMSYMTAIAGFALPLIWMEVQNLSVELQKEMAETLAIFKNIRPDLETADIEPVGNMPDGTQWCGFLAKSKHKTYVLIFREWNSDNTFTFPLDLPGKMQVKVLHSNLPIAEVSVSQMDKDLTITLSKPASFALIELR